MSNKKTENVILTNMCMIHDGNRILVQDRKKKDWPGITLPGGHVEIGELFIESVIREIYEETGLIIKSPKLVGIKEWSFDGIRYIALLYKTNEYSGKIKPSKEGEIFWINLDEIDKYKLAGSLKSILEIYFENNLK